MPCTTITIAEPAPADPLRVDGVNVELYPANDNLGAGKFGVLLSVVMAGEGTGILLLSWGTLYTEKKYNIQAASYNFSITLPPGTHNICAELV